MRYIQKYNSLKGIFEEEKEETFEDHLNIRDKALLKFGLSPKPSMSSTDLIAWRNSVTRYNELIKDKDEFYKNKMLEKEKKEREEKEEAYRIEREEEKEELMRWIQENVEREKRRMNSLLDKFKPKPLRNSLNNFNDEDDY